MITKQQRDAFAEDANLTTMTKFIDLADGVAEAARHFRNDLSNNGAYLELNEILMHWDSFVEDNIKVRPAADEIDAYELGAELIDWRP